MAFLSEFLELQAKYPERVTLTFDQEPGQSMLDIPAIVGGGERGTHFYCCGPAAMLTAFEAATEKLDPATVHIERFSSACLEQTVASKCISPNRGRSFFVPPEKTILEMLLSDGVQVNRSCSQGVLWHM